MTKVKLWISDIDGTIMNYDGSYTIRMKNLIDKINASDKKIVFATGRMYMAAQFALDEFNIKTPVVCYQGAVVRTKDKILWQSLIENNKAIEIYKYLRTLKIHTHLYNDGKLYVENDDKRIMSEYCDNRGTFYEVVNRFEDVQLNAVEKILCVIEDNETMQKTKEDLIKKYGDILTIVQSSKKYLEINNKNATKGEALKFLKKYWNLNDDEIIASGDQDNDVEMLKQAGIRISVNKNSEKLYNIANYHCKSVDSDELVDLVEKFML